MVNASSENNNNEYQKEKEQKDQLAKKIKEYRDITGDDISSKEDASNRLMYLEAFCRKIIKLELEKYVKSKSKSQKKK